MASAVVLNAVVIRKALLPAVLQLLGPTAWALPRWLDRRLLRAALEAEPTAQSWPRPEPALEAGS
jgi:putative drug exporter of the RND superfamily